MGKPKIFVLDTNVILHDHKAIRKFRDNNLVIPVAVIEEIDKFKKGTDTLSYNARGFMRDLDNITAGKNFGKGGLPSKAVMMRQIEELKEENAAIRAQNAMLEERLAAIEAKLAK